MMIESMEEIHLIQDNVLIRVEEPDEKTPTGRLYVPDTAKEKPVWGRVLRVGPGKRDEETGTRRPIEVSPGDRVLYGAWGGKQVEVEGEGELLIIPASLIFVISGEDGGAGVPA